MFQNIKDLYGKRLGALDGEIGHVKDFYFDDHTWAIRYLVADTEVWLANRLVLLSPPALGAFDRLAGLLPVNLTRKQIEESPSVDLHLPVSRQYEEEYHRYYGLLPYWEGSRMTGMTGPSVPPPQSPVPPPPAHQSRAGRHLQSALAVIGYHIQAVEGEIGHVSGFLADERWVIRDMVVETGHWYAGKEILISPAKIERISYEESKVFVSLTKEDIQRTEGHHLAKAS